MVAVRWNRLCHSFQPILRGPKHLVYDSTTPTPNMYSPDYARRQVTLPRVKIPRQLWPIKLKNVGGGARSVSRFCDKSRRDISIDREKYPLGSVHPRIKRISRNVKEIFRNVWESQVKQISRGVFVLCTAVPCCYLTVKLKRLSEG